MGSPDGSPRRPSRSRPVVVSVTTTAALEQEEAFTAALRADRVTLPRGAWPVPGVTAVFEPSGAWNREGVVRRLALSDRTEAVEELTDYSPGRCFASRVSSFTGVMGRLVSEVRDEWVFLPAGDGGGTRITWRASFRPRPGRRLVAQLLFPAWWRRSMRHGLLSAVRRLERRALDTRDDRRAAGG
ncbi:hypothetical protein NUM3379_28100 [Kineococcus sp. NUM-3379]